MNSARRVSRKQQINSGKRKDNMQEEFVVTIGICAFNVEEYISQALKSALDQTYQNIEIIVIDDGSTDGTGEILNRMTDARLTVIHKQNEGHAAGREQILGMMKGAAVYWLDSDDYLLPEAVANAVVLMKEHDADIVKTALYKKEKTHCGVYNREEYMHILLPDAVKSSVIGCLIRKKAYEGVHHKVGLVNEDYYTFPRIVDNARTIVLEDSGTYCHRIMRPGSVTYSGRNTFSGFYPRAIHRNDRYERYKDAFPEECGIVMKQFVDYACMACLYGGTDPRAEEVKSLLAFHEGEIARSPAVSSYKKWLTREILSQGKAIGAVRLLHKAKGSVRTICERLSPQ